MGLRLKGPPPPPSEYNSPADWTLIENWDTNNSLDDNEMAAINSAFNSSPRGSGGAFSPDGTKLTLCSTSDDTIKTFTLSTPWDPDTASETSTRNTVNPTHLYINAEGTQLWVLASPDTIYNHACTDFVFDGAAATSAAAKGEFGYNGSGDGGYYPAGDFSSMIWDGNQVGLGDRTRRGIFTPSGNLDSFSLSPLVPMDYIRSASTGGSKISNDGTTYYRGRGSSGIERVVMSTPYDPGTMTTTIFDMDAEIGFRPSYIVINPDDTSQVWIVGDNTGLQLARMATNV